MVALRAPLIGLLFCAGALLPLAASAQDDDTWFYGDDFSWVNDVPSEQSFGERDIWSETADVSTWGFRGFENVDQYVVVPPEELFQPYESLIAPLFISQNDETGWNYTTPQARFDVPVPIGERIGVMPISDEWEGRQAREQTHIDATLDAEGTEWQRRGFGELTQDDVRMLEDQTRQDRVDAAAPNREPVSIIEQLRDLFAPLPSPVAPATPDERFGNFDADAEYGGLDTNTLTTSGENRGDPSFAVPPDTETPPPAQQWGFDITEEERLAAETPPDTSKIISPSDKNSAYYGWFFGTKVPYLAKEWGNKTLEFLDIR